MRKLTLWKILSELYWQPVFFLLHVVIYPNAKNLASNLIADDGSIGIRFTKEEFTLIAKGIKKVWKKRMKYDTRNSNR